LSLSAIESCFSSVDYYKDKKSKIASVFRSIIKNHAFTDGNKRTAVLVLYLLCESTGVKLNKNTDELIHLTISVAENKFSVSEIKDMLF